ncbi:hypothetical protein EMPS_11067 [Entomortierella parvispora]|uniref:Uncharacterized protein n=1 Tax=Entomortierella parvispora TaxID=205924 RepID=A0A9P3HLW2_9FUNG|nr:hypothetical protein EMPS_11067 [Entomortierella parvispora]
MLARKGLSGSVAAMATMRAHISRNSTRTAACTAHSCSTYSSLTQRIPTTGGHIQRRLFSGSSLTRASEATPAGAPRKPQPIPLDIGSGAAPSAASASATSASHSTPGDSNALRRSLGGGSGSFFDRFGGPLFNIVVFSTAATLVLHVIYNKLALEEYQIASNKRIADLEAEIADLKAGTVRHASGGRGEFV